MPESRKEAKKILMPRAKKNLATVWLIGAMIVFILLTIQSTTGRYDDELVEVWGWFLQTVMPTLSLILSIAAIDATESRHDDTLVSFSFYRITLGLSVFYLFLVLLTILVQPFRSIAPLEAMKQANLWLGAVQGFVSMSLGVFFFKQKKKEKK